ncbi:hypothetical protein Q3P06_05785 [Ralstonia pseudosolanacearum]|uniref:hypothetical protein n=1 Tax=Ralstonia pseudosolanacearum TaxID=1310165 RepID=UPI0026765BB9|nr:hypothetical protein [Ralstonia pseudosolanacearum]MDO3511423.1 hypothetical protein [Ralstonia pseudosolanacearum]MDO3527971.1 hypothetical protein [Ralstonia pseudosolanacearum]MDO3632150.1 hypothetical protein [Ralstonia pseudosolanacearum]
MTMVLNWADAEISSAYLKGLFAYQAAVEGEPEANPYTKPEQEHQRAAFEEGYRDAGAA